MFDKKEEMALPPLDDSEASATAARIWRALGTQIGISDSVIEETVGLASQEPHE